MAREVILIVEDEEEIRELVRYNLAKDCQFDLAILGSPICECDFNNAIMMEEPFSWNTSFYTHQHKISVFSESVVFWIG